MVYCIYCKFLIFGQVPVPCLILLKMHVQFVDLCLETVVYICIEPNILTEEALCDPLKSKKCKS